MIINTIKDKEEHVKNSIILANKANIESVTHKNIIRLESKEAIFKKNRLDEIKKEKVELQKKFEQVNHLEGWFVKPKKLSRSFSRRELITEAHKEVSKYFFMKWKSQRKRYKETQQALIRKTKMKEREDEMKLIKEQENRLKELKAREWEKHMLFKEKRKADRALLTELTRSYSVTKVKEPLYKRYKERFEREVQLPLLEAYKKRIEDMKEKNKLYKKEELESCMKRYKEIAEQKEIERKERIRKVKMKEQSYIHFKKNFESPTLAKVREMDQVLKRNLTEKQLHKKMLRSRMNDYMSFVKGTIQVTSSQAKMDELKRRVKKLHHSPKQPKDIRSKYYNLAKIFGNSEFYKSIKKRKGGESTNPSSDSFKSIVRKPIDYLEELRKHKNNSAQSNSPLHVHLPRICTDWSSNLKDSRLTISQKRELILNRAKVIEDMAIMDERLLDITNNNNSDLGYKISSMILNSIKAKMSVFTDLT